MNFFMKTSRCVWMLAVIGVALAGPVQAVQNPPVQIRFQMDWQLDARAIPYFVAQKKGYFAHEGLEVTIRRGSGASATITRLAAGNADIGLGDMPSVIDFAANDAAMPVRAVFLMYETSQAALTAYIDKGVLIHGNAILVNTAFSTRHPEAVSGFLRAMSRALKDVFADRAEGIRILKAYEPLADAPVEMARLDSFLDKQIDTVNSRDQGVGVIDMPRLQKNVDLLAARLKFETIPDATTLVNMNFIPARSARQITKN